MCVHYVHFNGVHFNLIFIIYLKQQILGLLARQNRCLSSFHHVDHNFQLSKICNIILCYFNFFHLQNINTNILFQYIYCCCRRRLLELACLGGFSLQEPSSSNEPRFQVYTVQPFREYKFRDTSFFINQRIQQLAVASIDNSILR